MTVSPSLAEVIALSEPIFVCYTNTDLTEGRGYQVPYAWCQSRSTAVRLAAKRGVMGSDAEVRESLGLKVGAQIYGPVKFEQPGKQDKERDAKLAARAAVISKAREAGLSDYEIAVLTGARP